MNPEINEERSASLPATRCSREPLFCRAIVAFVSIIGFGTAPATAAELLAGVGKSEISEPSVKHNDPLFAKALVLKQDQRMVVLITVDAVAIAQIGHIRNEYLQTVRSELQKSYGIAPESVFVNASHCHGTVGADVAEKTLEAVRTAVSKMVPVKAGTGVSQEVRIMENRRLRLKDGSEADVRHAYSMPRDEDVVGMGQWILKSAFFDSIALTVRRSRSSTTLHAIPFREFPVNSALRTSRDSHRKLSKKMPAQM